MKYNPQKHHRRSIRLKGYDYSQPGSYFITICTQNREMLFGDVADGRMILNTIGKIIDYHWQRLPQHFKNIELDEYQIMPNHFHGIIRIVGAMHSAWGIRTQRNNATENASPLPHGTKPGSLGAIMQNFQSITTRKINKIRKTPGVRIWQRNYWEHIIRNEQELNRIRQYIIENPLKWQDDKYFK
ncbi:MAG: transposase [Calditrichaeota bacterium]|nr:transposase [Calditrichota bacterium]